MGYTGWDEITSMLFAFQSDTREIDTLPPRGDKTSDSILDSISRFLGWPNERESTCILY